MPASVNVPRRERWLGSDLCPTSQLRFTALPRLEYGQFVKQRQPRVGQRDPEMAKFALARERPGRGITNLRRGTDKIVPPVPKSAPTTPPSERTSESPAQP